MENKKKEDTNSEHQEKISSPMANLGDEGLHG